MGQNHILTEDVNFDKRRFRMSKRREYFDSRVASSDCCESWSCWILPHLASSSRILAFATLTSCSQYFSRYPNCVCSAALVSDSSLIDFAIACNECENGRGLYEHERKKRTLCCVSFRSCIIARSFSMAALRNSPIWDCATAKVDISFCWPTSIPCAKERLFSMAWCFCEWIV